MRVSSIHLRAAVEAAVSRGVNAVTLLGQAGVSVELLSASYSWLDVQALDRVMRAAVSLTGDPAFGLHWGNGASMNYDLASPLVAHAPSLRASIDSLLRFQAILADRAELHFAEQGDLAVFRFEPLAETVEGHRVRADLAVSGFCRLLRMMGVGAKAIRRVTFAHARPAYADEYAVLLAQSIQFDHAFPSIEFERGELERTRMLGNPELHRALESQASSMRTRLLSEDPFETRLKLQVRNALPRVPTMQIVASSLGMSERSLRRRLTELSLSYSTLVEQTKREIADELLRTESQGITQVAEALGFSSVSAFHRAFKRWTGDTPASFRKRVDSSLARG